MGAGRVRLDPEGMMQGEYMIWTDGAAYCCLTDTVYSPADYPSAWEKV